jgi:hypothetical protein
MGVTRRPTIAFLCRPYTISGTATAPAGPGLERRAPIGHAALHPFGNPSLDRRLQQPQVDRQFAVFLHVVPDYIGKRGIAIDERGDEAQDPGLPPDHRAGETVAQAAREGGHEFRLRVTKRLMLCSWTCRCSAIISSAQALDDPARRYDNAAAAAVACPSRSRPCGTCSSTPRVVHRTSPLGMQGETMSGSAFIGAEPVLFQVAGAAASSDEMSMHQLDARRIDSVIAFLGAIDRRGPARAINACRSTPGANAIPR